MEEAKQLGYDYVQNNICYDDVVRKLTEAYLDWFEREQKHVDNEDVIDVATQNWIWEGEAWEAIEEWIMDFFEKNLTRLGDYV